MTRGASCVRRGGRPPGRPVAAQSVGRRRAGYVLIGVLWAVVAMAALAMTAAVAGRDAVAAAGNRAALARAAWQADACAARWFAGADAALADAPRGQRTGDPVAAARVWHTLDRALNGPIPTDAGEPAGTCTVQLTAAGSALDLNTADGEDLQRLCAALGVPPAMTDSLVDALLDWRDADATARPAGAEAAWYVAHGRAPPRDGPLAAVAELARVRGFAPAALDARVPGLAAALQTAVGVEPGRVDLAHAPRAVLAALPGMSPEAIDAILTMRNAPAAPAMGGDQGQDLFALAAHLSRDAREGLHAHVRDLQARTTWGPDAWIVTARGIAGAPRTTAVLELRVVRSGTRLAVVRRRGWTE